MKARKLISTKELEAHTGLARTTLYRYMDEGGFPRPVRTGKRAFWVVEEVEKWFADRITAGVHVPKPRRPYKRRTKAAAPKPRIYKDGESWCINANSNLTLRSNSPQVVYRLWQQWSHA